MAEVAVRQPGKRLTAQFVRNVSEPGKYFDGHGLYLRVDKKGGRFWIQRIVVNGKRREIGLGSPVLTSLAEARGKALENHKLARSGGDPLLAKKEAKAVPSFADAARTVHELHRPTWSNAKHAAQFISTLETYAFQHIGKSPIDRVSAADILKILTPIWTSKPETARRVKQRLGTVLKWAVAQGWREDDPTAAISQALPKNTAGKKHRKALPYAEVHTGIAAVQASEATLSCKLAIELLVLTATRSGEVRNARWEEFSGLGIENVAAEGGNAVWEIPAERMKMKPHRIPLSQRAVELLIEARALDDESGLVFPGTKVGRPLSDMTMSKLIKELGFDADVHGFRTSFRTWAQEKTNFPREIAEAALAHATGDAVERAYARSDVFDKRRTMMAAWAQYLAPASGNVVVASF